ncbi:MAG TPA: pyridoxamine 5'-phosphate oxidase [Gaiellaceae bacterium]|nr:pyridoxamine 5'-phosphate oxidase [Gaiellaceae bacterium]
MDESELGPDPVREVAAWYADAVAAGLPQPEAMALATVGRDGRPSVRMVLLRSHDERGFTFFTNRESRKGAELAANPRAALVLYWQPLSRQVRIEGVVEELSSSESAEYFATRPRGSRIAAWASAQSRPVEDRAQLDRLYTEADARFRGGDIPLPPFWGGYRVVPDAIELWDGRENRLHDRVRYERDPDGWSRIRLQP